MSATSGLRVRAQDLEWDSQFFGRRIASICGTGLEKDALDATLADARGRGIECLYALTEVDDLRAIRTLEARGARLVDVRITLERRLDQPVARGPLARVRPALDSDAPALRALAMRSHGTSRFYSDGRFPVERCDELYGTWIVKSLGGWADFVLVAERESAPCGYLTGHARAGGCGEIGLVAIAPDAQGEGLGSQLLLAGLAEFQARGLRRSTVVTQGSNLAAQRLYQASGYRTSAVQTWHHLWLDEAERRR